MSRYDEDLIAPRTLTDQGSSARCSAFRASTATASAITSSSRPRPRHGAPRARDRRPRHRRRLRRSGRARRRVALRVFKRSNRDDRRAADPPQRDACGRSSRSSAPGRRATARASTPRRPSSSAGRATASRRARSAGSFTSGRSARAPTRRRTSTRSATPAAQTTTGSSPTPAPSRSSRATHSLRMVARYTPPERRGPRADDPGPALADGGALRRRARWRPAPLPPPTRTRVQGEPSSGTRAPNHCHDGASAEANAAGLLMPPSGVRGCLNPSEENKHTAVLGRFSRGLKTYVFSKSQPVSKTPVGNAGRSRHSLEI